MPREKRPREEVKKLKESVVEKHKKESASLPPIVRDTGGSIAALNGNKSLFFKKWVRDLQTRKNPLIGKDYIMAAEEYNTEAKMVGDPEIEELSPEMDSTLKKGAEEYKSNIVEPNKDAVADFLKDKEAVGEETSDIELESFKEHGDEAECNFIDISIVENLTKELQDQIDEDIEKEAREKLKEYHQDDDYEPEIDIPSVIENYKFLLIAQNSPDKKLLN